MKNKLFLVLACFLIIGFMSSCVVKKKYLQEQNQRIETEKKLNALESDLESCLKSVKVLGKKVSELEKSILGKDEEIVKLEDNNMDLKDQIDKITSESLSNKQRMDLSLKTRLKELEQREIAIKELEDMLKKKDMAMRDLMTNITNALNQYSSDELTIEMIDGKVYIALSDKLLFKSGSAKLDDNGKKALSLLAEVLIKQPELDVIIEGHTDNVPIRTDKYSDNWDLSVIRATSVIRILTEEYGLSSKQVTASGRGEYIPKATNETSEGKALNRRTEIIIAPKLGEIYKALSR